MLAFMGENKRLLDIHNQKFAELAAFQANTIVFHANTNASFKNLETRVGAAGPSHVESIPSDTRKNPKD